MFSWRDWVNWYHFLWLHNTGTKTNSLVNIIDYRKGISLKSWWSTHFKRCRCLETLPLDDIQSLLYNVFSVVGPSLNLVWESFKFAQTQFVQFMLAVVWRSTANLSHPSDFKAFQSLQWRKVLNWKKFILCSFHGICYLENLIALNLLILVAVLV